MFHAKVSQGEATQEGLTAVEDGSETYCARQKFPYRLVRLTHDGYKIWNWRRNLEGRRLIHSKRYVMDIHKPSNLPRMVNVANRWTTTRIGQEPDQCDKVCTIREMELAVVAVVSNTDPPHEEKMPTKIK